MTDGKTVKFFFELVPDSRCNNAQPTAFLRQGAQSFFHTLKEGGGIIILPQIVYPQCKRAGDIRNRQSLQGIFSGNAKRESQFFERRFLAGERSDRILQGMQNRIFRIYQSSVYIKYNVRIVHNRPPAMIFFVAFTRRGPFAAASARRLFYCIL